MLLINAIVMKPWKFFKATDFDQLEECPNVSHLILELDYFFKNQISSK